MYFEKFAEYYNTVNILNANIEFEIKLLLDPRLKTPTFIKNNNKLSTAIERAKAIFKQLSDTKGEINGVLL